MGRIPRWDVLGFGAVAVDDLIYVDHHPLPDSKTTVRDLRREGGGLTGTALVAAARLGARAAYAGVLGDDELSHFTLQAFEREEVDCTPVIHRPGARPIHSFVIVDLSTAQRSILASFHGVVQRPPEAMTEELIESCRVLFVDHTNVPGGLRAVEIAHGLGIPVVADIEFMREPGVEKLLDRVDHLIIGVELAEEITGRADPAAAVKALASPSRACCVVTAGERGCWYAERDGEARHFPAFRVETVDTTGCGDVFHGAYAAWIAQGGDVPEAIRVASAAAALKAMHPGGRSGIPGRMAVLQFLEERSI
ncbi:MAG: hypothetical protein J7M34_01280 [Anaerolineae bacterium]|nr:hypothetical protein [Anaerolineae bacterium]